MPDAQLADGRRCAPPLILSVNRSLVPGLFGHRFFLGRRAELA